MKPECQAYNTLTAINSYLKNIKNATTWDCCLCKINIYQYFLQFYLPQLQSLLILIEGGREEGRELSYHFSHHWIELWIGLLNCWEMFPSWVTLVLSSYRLMSSLLLMRSLLMGSLFIVVNWYHEIDHLKNSSQSAQLLTASDTGKLI